MEGVEAAGDESTAVEAAAAVEEAVEESVAQVEKVVAEVAETEESEAGEEKEDKEDKEDKEGALGEKKSAPETETRPADADNVDEATDASVEQVYAMAEETSAAEEKEEATTHEREQYNGEVDTQETCDASESPVTAGRSSVSAGDGDGELTATWEEDSSATTTARVLLTFYDFRINYITKRSDKPQPVL